MEPNNSHLPNTILKAQSQTEQDEGFFSVLLDITKKHPILFTVFFLIPFVVLLISLGFKWYYIFTDTNHYLSDFQIQGGKWTDSKAYFGPGIDKYIRELDIAGLVGGIVGIFIGLYLTVTTEKLNRQKERTNQQEMDHLKTQTGLLVQATKSLNSIMVEVSGKVNEKVQLMEGTKDVLEGIDKVIDLSKAQGNNLLVLSNTARIEAISPFRMDLVAKHADLKPHELRHATQFDYARKAEALLRDCTDVENKLKETAIYLQKIGSDARVEFVTLNDQNEGASHAFLKYLGKIFNEHVSVETYRSGSNAPMAVNEAIPHHNRFMVAINTQEDTDTQSLLIRQLYNDHAQAMREMQELGIRVTKVNKTLPIQLFISTPNDNKPGIQKTLCVCILGSGSNSSGRPSKLTAFLTDDPHIVSSMVELFYDYESDAALNTREFMRKL
jgi:uncharacterized membrane-anchored protein YhcB (DUF1043 family)